jgi:hypothetical protein
VPGTAFSVHPELAGRSRLTVLSWDRQQSDCAAILFLFGVGAVAAVTTLLLDFRLRIPGHAILRAVFPMAFGLALAPRRMGGMVMGAGALSSALVIKVGGFAAVGAGAMTSLLLTGPLLDLVLWRSGRGWRLYLGFVLAGLAANVIALGARAGVKLSGIDTWTGRPLAAWWLQAVITYAVCGALAGLISALVWFRFSASRRTSHPPERAA